MYRVKLDTTPYLNIRSKGALTGDIVGFALPGARIDVKQMTNGWILGEWNPTTQVTLRGWMSAAYIEQVGVTEPPLGSSVGVHIAFSGSTGDIVGANQRLAAAGKHPLYLVVSDHGLANKLKADNPLATVVYRWVAGSGDPSPFGENENAPGWWHGAAWFEELWRRHSQAPSADFHQMYNEVNFANNAQSEEYARRVCQFELELMHRANERGVKVTIGNYMPGVPEKRHIVQLKPALAFAELWGHALCYHGYSSASNDATFTADAEYYFLRWKEWVDPYPNLRVILGEVNHFNSPRFRGVEDMLARMQETDNLLLPLRKAGRKVDQAWWTIRGQNDVNWKHDDWTPHVSAWEQYVRSK